MKIYYSIWFGLISALHQNILQQLAEIKVELRAHGLLLDRLLSIHSAAGVRAADIDPLPDYIILPATNVELLEQLDNVAADKDLYPKLVC